MIARLVCALLGHRWYVEEKRCHRVVVLGHLHELAGCLARCERCGATWDDRCEVCRTVAALVEVINDPTHDLVPTGTFQGQP